MRCRGGTMAPVAWDYNRCNYVWKFLIHPIMFDNSPAFHVNFQCFAAHGQFPPRSILYDKFASERLYITIDWFITHEDRIKNFFNPEYIRIRTCVNTLDFSSGVFRYRRLRAFRYDASIERWSRMGPLKRPPSLRNPLCKDMSVAMLREAGFESLRFPRAVCGASGVFDPFHKQICDS